MMKISTLLLTCILSYVFADDYAQDEDELYFAPRENYPGYPYPYHASPYERPVQTYAGYEESPFQQRMVPSFWPPFGLWRKPLVKHPEILPEQPIPVYELKPKKPKKVKWLKPSKFTEDNYEAIKQQPQPVQSPPPNYNPNTQAEKLKKPKKVCKCES